MDHSVLVKFQIEEYVAVIDTIRYDLNLVNASEHYTFELASRFPKSFKMTTIRSETENSSAKASIGGEHRTYEDAIKVLKKSREITSEHKKPGIHGLNHRLNHPSSRPFHEETEGFLQKVSISMDDLDQLSVIHVTGTKGKGTTCTLTEQILRNLNVKTGSYVCPQMLSITERFCINGKPISKSLFLQYFWEIYDKLELSKQNTDYWPSFTVFCPLIAFYIFLKEKVDVAIVEVNVGGEYDSTNVLRNTKTVGITSIGLDHVEYLGNRLEDIAWHKSGIIKSGSNAFSNKQYDECIPVMLGRAQEKNATICFVPDFSEYKYDDEKVLSEIAAHPSKLRNASLALQLSYDWIRKNEQKIKNQSLLEHLNSSDGGMILVKEVADALLNCPLPGRCQKMQMQNMTIHADTAHTTESIQVCVDWFKAATQSSNSRKKILIFNMAHRRDITRMLDLLNQNVKFDEALFTPNILSIATISIDSMLSPDEPDRTQWNSECWSNLSEGNKSQAFGCLSDVFEYLQTNYGNEALNVLVTGTVYLIGELLRKMENSN